MDNKILATLVAVFVGIIMLGSVLIPTITDAKLVVGDPIELEQTGSRSPYLLGKVPTDDTVTLAVGTEGVTVNGELVEIVASPSTWTPIIYTDGGFVQIRNESGTTKATVYTLDNNATDVSLESGNTAVFDGGVCTITASSTTTFNYSECYSIGYNDDMRLLIDMGMRYNTHSMVNSINDVTIYGWYATGENDTQYSFKDGKLSVVGDYESSVDYELTLHEGTTDIYDITKFNVTIGGETFVPYYALVPEIVEGHADSGAAYDIVGAIPIIIIIAIVLLAAGLIFRSRY